jgi:hypothetical protein
MLTEIDPFGVGAVVGDSKLKTEESAACRRCDIYIDDAVTHFKVVQNRRSTIEEEAFASLILSRFGLSLQIPTRGVRGNCQSPRFLGKRGGGT